MNIACASCPAKYAVPDDKVRGRKVRITCKRCGAAIIVDGTSLGASGAPSAPEPAAPSSSAGSAEPSAPQPSSAAGAAADAKPSDANQADAPAPSAAQAPAAVPANEKPPADSPKVAPAVEPAPAPVAAKAQLKPLTATLGAAKPLASVAKQPAGAEAKLAFPKPGAATAKIGGLGKAATAAAAPAAASAGATTTQAARAVAVPRATAAARAVAPSALPERTWTVAITDDDHREMTLAQVVDAYAAETIDSETFIWREGMQDWLMPFEIAEIAAALRARRLSPRTSSPGSKAGEPFGQEPAGAWREPGRWDRDEPSPDEPSFDDVTVAMEAPKAKALLQAVASNEEAAPAAAPAPAAGTPARVASKNDEPTTVGPPFAVTPEQLGFGAEGGASAKAEAADAPAAERVPEKLPFELSQSPARAALKVASSDAEPRDLFARSAGGDESAAEPKDIAAANDDSPADAAPEDGDAEAKALTGARNESSVLFSLDQLSRAGAKPAPAAKKKKTDEAALLLGGSGAGTHEIAPVAGGLFGQANMAAPDFTAPPPPSVPPPANKRQPTSSAPTSSAPRPASGAGKWIGLAAGLVAIGGGAFFLTRSPAPAPAPSATAVPAVATTPPPSLTAPAAAEPSAAAPAAESPAENTSAAAAASGSAAPMAAGSAAATAAAAPPGTAPAAPGATAPATTPTGAVPGAPAGTPKPQATATAKPTAAASAAAAPAPAEGPDFDKDAAAAALASAASRAEGECGASEGPHGTGKVAVTFANSGRATNALVSGDFAGSALGGCVARIFRGVKVPAFGGEPVRVSKTVRIP